MQCQGTVGFTNYSVCELGLELNNQSTQIATCEIYQNRQKVVEKHHPTLDSCLARDNHSLG